MALDYTVIGQRIKQARLAKNLTQEDLAEAVDVCTALIGNLESENIEQGVSVITLVKLSKTLGVSIDDLLSPTQPK